MSAPPVPTSSRVSSLAMRGQRIDRVRAQPHPAEPSVDPAQVAQVPGSAAGSSSGPSSSSTASVRRSIEGSVRRARTMASHDRRRRRGPDRPPRAPRRTAGGDPGRRAVQHGPDDRAARVAGRVPRPAVDRPIRRRCCATRSSDPASTCRWPTRPTRRPRSPSPRLDAAGAATLPIPHRRDIRAEPVARGRSVRALAMRPRAVHLGTLGLVLEPMATALAVAVAADRRRHAGHARSELPAARSIRDRDGLSRPPRAHRATGRCRQGQRRRPRLPRAGPAAAAAARAILAAARRSCSDRWRRARAGARHDDRCRPGPRPAVAVVDTVGAGDAFGGGFLARWIERGAGRAELADTAAVHDAVTFADRGLGPDLPASRRRSAASRRAPPCAG